MKKVVRLSTFPAIAQLHRNWILLMAAVLFACAGFLSPVVFAQGPVDSFPSFTPFSFDNFEFPEGVAVDKAGNVYVSVRFSLEPPWGPISGSDQIWKFTPDGQRSLFFDFGGTTGGGAFGLAVDAEGNVYMARSIAIPTDSQYGNGVFRIDKRGTAVLLPGTDEIGLADGLAFDDRGNLYITEAHSLTSGAVCPYGPGGIWVVPKGGTAKLWLRDELLTGSLCYGLVGRPFGANGIAYYQHNLYVVSSDKGTVVQVPVLDDGSAGQPQIWAQLQEIDAGGTAAWGTPPVGDGLAMDVYGNVYVVLFSRCAIVRIDAADRSQHTVASLLPNLDGAPFAPLDFPTSLAFGTAKGGRMQLFVTGVGAGVLFNSQVQWPGPGLAKIQADTPGLPMP